MTANDEKNGFNSLLNEKCILNDRLKKVYELTLSESYDEALYELESMSKRYPYIVDIYHIKFKIYCIKENYNLAEKVLSEAELLFSDNEKITKDRVDLTKLKNTLNNDYLINGEYEELAKSSEEEIENNKSENISVSSYYYRALSYRMLNNKNSNSYYNEACKVYKNLNQKNIKDKKEDFITTSLYKALCHKDMKQYGEALRIVNSILENDLENREAMKIKMSIIKELKSRKA